MREREGFVRALYAVIKRTEELIKEVTVGSKDRLLFTHI